MCERAAFVVTFLGHSIGELGEPACSFHVKHVPTVVSWEARRSLADWRLLEQRIAAGQKNSGVYAKGRADEERPPRGERRGTFGDVRPRATAARQENSRKAAGWRAALKLPSLRFKAVETEALRQERFERLQIMLADLLRNPSFSDSALLQEFLGVCPPEVPSQVSILRLGSRAALLAAATRASGDTTSHSVGEGDSQRVHASISAWCSGGNVRQNDSDCAVAVLEVFPANLAPSDDNDCCAPIPLSVHFEVSVFELLLREEVDLNRRRLAGTQVHPCCVPTLVFVPDLKIGCAYEFEVRTLNALGRSAGICLPLLVATAPCLEVSSNVVALDEQNVVKLDEHIPQGPGDSEQHEVEGFRGGRESDFGSCPIGSSICLDSLLGLASCDDCINQCTVVSLDADAQALYTSNLLGDADCTTTETVMTQGSLQIDQAALTCGGGESLLNTHTEDMLKTPRVSPGLGDEDCDERRSVSNSRHSSHTAESAVVDDVSYVFLDSPRHEEDRFQATNIATGHAPHTPADSKLVDSEETARIMPRTEDAQAPTFGGAQPVGGDPCTTGSALHVAQLSHASSGLCAQAPSGVCAEAAEAPLLASSSSAARLGACPELGAAASETIEAAEAPSAVRLSPRAELGAAANQTSEAASRAGYVRIVAFEVAESSLPAGHTASSIEALVLQVQRGTDMTLQQALRLVIGSCADLSVIEAKRRDISHWRRTNLMEKVRETSISILHDKALAGKISFPHAEDMCKLLVVNPCALVTADGRPVSVWHVGTINSRVVQSLSSERLQVWSANMFEYVDTWLSLESQKQMQLVGHVQIFDLQGMSMWHATNSALIEKLKSAFSAGGFYMEAVSHIYVVNSSSMFSMVWQIVKTMISPRTSSKITVASDVPRKLLTELGPQSSKKLQTLLKARHHKAPVLQPVA